MLAALDEVVLGDIGNGQKARIGGLVQVIPRVKFATKTRHYPDSPVMPTLVCSVGVLAAGWGCRWWAGRDKPKLVEASKT